jgi:hypothetical protein
MIFPNGKKFQRLFHGGNTNLREMLIFPESKYICFKVKVNVTLDALQG